jgi:hypothetical protein
MIDFKNKVPKTAIFNISPNFWGILAFYFASKGRGPKISGPL